MKVRQLSVFLENRKGRLCEVCSLLGDNGINIRALTVAETETFGVLRIVVDNPDKAAQTLKDNKITANITNVVAVEVKDQPGGLAGILKVVADNDINVEYMYGFVEKSSDNALMVFRFEDPERAVQILAENRIRAVGEQDIAGL
ncbi:MAG: ACT domain-containing protein [Sedimentisphaerales bacterium]|nr:ACT domain-containing protein [Sedimentisphaerales bacterium]